MKTILCPTDFSPNTDNAMEYACALAEKFRSQVILFHAYEEQIIMVSEAVMLSETINTNIRSAAEKKINVLKETLQKKFSNCVLTTELSVGSAHKEIVLAANRMDAELIVMGTTGTGRIERLLIGSTTAQVLKEANCPVLCIPNENKYTDIKKIVFATNLEGDNISAAINIAPFAEKLNAEIIFVFIDNKHLMHDEKDIIPMTQKIKSRVKYPKISGYVANNPDIAKGIEYFSKKYSADLVVTFAHDRHFPESLLNASITKSLSNKISIPLLVLKHDEQLTG